MNEWKDVVVVYAQKLLFATVESSGNRKISEVTLRDWYISLFKKCPYLSTLKSTWKQYCGSHRPKEIVWYSFAQLFFETPVRQNKNPNIFPFSQILKKLCRLLSFAYYGLKLLS